MSGKGEGQNQMCNLCVWLKNFVRWVFFIFSFASLSAVFCLAVADNVPALGEEADFEALNCLPALNVIRSTKLHLSTEPAFLPNAC